MLVWLGLLALQGLLGRQEPEVLLALLEPRDLLGRLGLQVLQGQRELVLQERLVLQGQLDLLELLALLVLQVQLALLELQAQLVWDILE
jgi:hypothetical protein